MRAGDDSSRLVISTREPSATPLPGDDDWRPWVGPAKRFLRVLLKLRAIEKPSHLTSIATELDRVAAEPSALDEAARRWAMRAAADVREARGLLAAVPTDERRELLALARRTLADPQALSAGHVSPPYVDQVEDERVPALVSYLVQSSTRIDHRAHARLLSVQGAWMEAGGVDGVPPRAVAPRPVRREPLPPAVERLRAAAREALRWGAFCLRGLRSARGTPPVLPLDSLHAQTVEAWKAAKASGDGATAQREADTLVRLRVCDPVTNAVLEALRDVDGHVDPLGHGWVDVLSGEGKVVRCDGCGLSRESLRRDATRCPGRRSKGLPTRQIEWILARITGLPAGR